MRGGIWVLTIFAAIWGAAGVLGTGMSPLLAAVPVAVSVALLFWATRQPGAPVPEAEQARIGRLVGIWSAVEGVAIFVGVTVCQNIGAAHAIAPVIAIIVGLHFLPLARGIPVPVYYGTALALVATGAGALLWLPPSHQLPATGGLAAFILWVSCVELVSAPGRASVDR